MSTYSTSLIPRATIEELVGHRDRAVELYDDAARRLRDAQEAHARAASGHTYIRRREFERTGRDVVKDVDRDAWKGALKTTGLLDLMDAKERTAFEKQIEDDPPPFTVENVSATCFRLLGEAGPIFNRGLVTAFRRLSREYASNDGFKIGPRIVVDYAFSTYGDGRGGVYIGSFRKDDDLADVDRAMHVLDGKPYERRGPTSIITAIEAARAERNGRSEAETPYWRARWFKNGNAHLYPLRDDLRRRVNLIIADHFGLAVAKPGKRRAA
ncbi:DUF4942 domain-containing protein [Salinarimonas sp. NSM]|uniref:DUF4942 domain-containing protein n=1 Tax=Salinarimonas sp. NSM TaxID=3458003 RepID=UPI0040354CBB